MITRIELHNFMSHRKTVVEPSPWLTVLVGPNNCGKSAFVTALQILCHNENSTYVKRHGAKECAVVVHTSDGNVVEWRRKTSPRYLINGREFGRLGNSGLPPELHALLRLPLVADEADDSFDVHFGSQKSPIFLLNSRAGTAAKFFASSSDAIRLLEMQQRHKEKVTEARRQHQRLEAEAAVVAAELEALEATVPLADLMADLEKEFERCGEIDREINQLAETRHELLDRLKRAERYSAHCDSLSDLAAPPKLDDPKPLSDSIDRIESTLRRGERLTRESAALVDLPAPPQLADDIGLERIVEKVHAVGRRIEELSEQRTVFGALTPAPALQDAIALEATVRQLEKSYRQVSTTESRTGLLSGLEPPPAIDETAPLDSLLERIDQQRCTVEQLDLRLSAAIQLSAPPVIDDEQGLSEQLDRLASATGRGGDLTALVDSLDREMAEIAAQLRDAVQGQSCPTCGQQFDADRLLEISGGRLGGHAHD